MNVLAMLAMHTPKETVYQRKIGIYNGHNGIATVAGCINTGYICAANAAQAPLVYHVLWGR
jgi:hypothetical protein